jgi:hypothetical protein
VPSSPPPPTISSSPPGQGLVRRKTFLLEAQSVDLRNTGIEQVPPGTSRTTGTVKKFLKNQSVMLYYVRGRLFASYALLKGFG